MDGFEVLDAMRARTATRDVPVIVVTGQSVTDAQLERLGPGVATILRKGVFTPHETAAGSRLCCRATGAGSATQQVVRRAMDYIEKRFRVDRREEIARQSRSPPTT